MRRSPPQMANRTSKTSAPEGVPLSGAELEALRQLAAGALEAAKAFEGLARGIEILRTNHAVRTVTRKASATFSAHVRWHVQRHKLKAGCSFCAGLMP